MIGDVTEASKVAIIECDPELYTGLCTTLQHAITGKPVYYGDSLKDIVDRHCPVLYELAKDEGFHFVPSSDSGELVVNGQVRVWFDVIRIKDAS